MYPFSVLYDHGDPENIWDLIEIKYFSSHLSAKQLSELPQKENNKTHLTI